MLCTQIISEYERQTQLLERILAELQKLNERTGRNSAWKSSDEDPNSITKMVDRFGNKRLLSVKETAEYLGISPATIYNRVARSSERAFPIKPKRFGRRVRFDRKDVEEYLETMCFAPAFIWDRSYVPHRSRKLRRMLSISLHIINVWPRAQDMS